MTAARAVAETINFHHDLQKCPLLECQGRRSHSIAVVVLLYSHCLRRTRSCARASRSRPSLALYPPPPHGPFRAVPLLLLCRDGRPRRPEPSALIAGFGKVRSSTPALRQESNLSSGVKDVQCGRLLPLVAPAADANRLAEGLCRS